MPPSWEARGAAETTVALNLVRATPAPRRAGRSWSTARGTSAATPGPRTPGTCPGRSTTPTLADRRERQTRARVDVAVYTPGNPQGHPLSIAIGPGRLSGRLGLRSSLRPGDRAVRRRGPGSRDDELRPPQDRPGPTRLRSWPTRSTCSPGSGRRARCTLPGLIEYVLAEKDHGLVNAVGRLDTRLFEKLVQDLETLRLTRGDFLAARGEPLKAESLLGLGRHAAGPGEPD